RQGLARAKVAHTDKTLLAAGRDRVALDLEAILYLREFLALYPDHALAPDAGMNLVTAYLDLLDHGRVELLAGRLAERFPEPRLRDNFRYTRAVAAWYQDKSAAALELLSGIVTARYPDERGNEQVSENRDLALYLSGQIYHADGDLEKAASLYAKVAQHFKDAAELEELLHESNLGLPEVTQAAPGEDLTLEVTHKAAPEVELQLFPVDLMTLYLREGNLEDIGGVNLAGISPVLRRTFELPAPLAMDAKRTSLELGQLAPGAYLAILRGAGHFASGLVLVSDLDLVVREDPDQGAVRVEVSRGSKLLEGVDVRVVGSQSGNFQSGETDRRGLYTTSGIHGTATVIARLDRTTYAFHRGTARLGGEGGTQTGSGDWFLGQSAQNDDAKEKSVDWFSNVGTSNSIQQESRRGNLEENWNKKSKGVQVQKIQ
ncbi:MAG: hypothetical protein P1V81_03745, partial [Planctomycetota bacterium]|nr:hypothetical protein [Planctomycetota bacterium]